MAAPRWLRAAVLAFPRGFRERHRRDFEDTLDDLIAHAEPADRPRVARRAFVQTVRSGLAERAASLSLFSPKRPRPAGAPSSSSGFDDLRHDAAHAWRSVVRRPGFAAVVMLTLAIGLGGSAAMFSVIDGVLLEPLPYAESDRLVTLLRTFTNDPSREADNMSLPDFRDVQEGVSEIVASAGYRRARETLQLEDGPRLILTAGVTDGLLPVFGLAPHIGRDLEAKDALLDAPRVVVLGYDFWTRYRGSNPGVLGQTIELSGETFEIVGVAPPSFDFPGRVQVYTALQIDTENDCGRGCHLLDSVARIDR
ncbi:MAG: ABC transporter permease, partial [Acidobacteriota bacterium]